MFLWLQVAMTLYQLFSNDETLLLQYNVYSIYIMKGLQSFMQFTAWSSVHCRFYIVSN